LFSSRAVGRALLSVMFIAAAVNKVRGGGGLGVWASSLHGALRTAPALGCGFHSPREDGAFQRWVFEGVCAARSTP
jgi:hypothetical protein